MRVKLLRRLGQNPAHSTLDVRDAEGDWLIERGAAVATQAGPRRHPEPPDESSIEPAVESEPDPQTATLADLRSQAEDLGLPTYGTKAQLAARIAEADE